MFNDDISINSLGVNKSVPIFALGNYIHVLEATGNIEVIAENNKGGNAKKTGSMQISPNDGRELTEICNQWTIKNTSGAVQSLKLSIGMGRILDSSVNLAADVNAITEPKNQTLDDNEFSGFSTYPAVSSLYALTEIWNPVASGKIVDVSKLKASTNAATITDGIIALYRIAAATGGYPVGFGVNGLVNHKSGGAASLTEIKRGAVATHGLAGYTHIDMLGCGVTTLMGKAELERFSRDAPFELAQGEGIGAIHMLVNTGMNIHYEWSER